MKRFALIAALFLVMSATLAEETIKDSNEAWVPFDFSPEELENLLGNVRADGSRILEFEFSSYRSEGVLEGCGYTYNVLLTDWAYRSNQPTLAYGSIIYFKFRERVPLLSLRIGLVDLKNDIVFRAMESSLITTASLLCMRLKLLIDTGRLHY